MFCFCAVIVSFPYTSPCSPLCTPLNCVFFVVLQHVMIDAPLLSLFMLWRHFWVLSKSAWTKPPRDAQSRPWVSFWKHMALTCGMYAARESAATAVMWETNELSDPRICLPAAWRHTAGAAQREEAHPAFAPYGRVSFPAVLLLASKHSPCGRKKSAWIATPRFKNSTVSL